MNKVSTFLAVKNKWHFKQLSDSPFPVFGQASTICFLHCSAVGPLSFSLCDSVKISQIEITKYIYAKRVLRGPDRHFHKLDLAKKFQSLIENMCLLIWLTF